MLRSLLGTAVVATALVAPAPSTVAAAPARTDPMAGLDAHPEWGRVIGKSGVLKRGCRTYTYTYSIAPPEGIWALEVFISGPGLKRLAAGAFAYGYDPLSGTGHYKLCKMTTRYGRFTIDAKVSVDDGTGNFTEGRLPTDHYRLHRRHH